MNREDIKNYIETKERMNTIVMVLGIISLVLTIISFGFGIIISFPLSVIAIILFFFSDKKNSGKALIGLFSSIVSILITISFIVLLNMYLTAYLSSSFMTNEDFLGDLNEETISLLFNNRVEMYQIPGDTFILEILTIKDYEYLLRINEFKFEGPEGVITCSERAPYIIRPEKNNTFRFFKVDDNNCDGNFVLGMYNLSMEWIIPIRVEQIEFN